MTHANLKTELRALAAAYHKEKDSDAAGLIATVLTIMERSDLGRAVSLDPVTMTPAVALRLNKMAKATINPQRRETLQSAVTALLKPKK